LTLGTDLPKRMQTFFVTNRNIEIVFSEICLTCLIIIRSLSTHQKIKIENWTPSTIYFLKNCSKTDSVWWTVVKEVKCRWRFWLSILVQVSRPRYVRTARWYSDVMKFNLMECESRLIDGENGCRLSFENHPWNLECSTHPLASRDSTDCGANTWSPF
jgi:hypothetical protein